MNKIIALIQNLPETHAVLRWVRKILLKLLQCGQAEKPVEKGIRMQGAISSRHSSVDSDTSVEEDIQPYEPEVIRFLRPGIQENFHHQALRKAGCYFFTLYRWAEHVLGKPLGEENVVPLFNKCIEAGAVKPNGFIKNPVAVLNLLCGKSKFSRIVTHTNDPAVSPSLPVYARRVMSGKFTHFLLSINGCTWDSLGSNVHNYRPAGLREIA